MNNVNKRLSVYFKHHIVAKVKVTPPPSNVSEVNHIFHNLSSLGNLEYFNMQRDRTKINTYGNSLTLIYNPTSSQSLLGSMLFSKSGSYTLADFDNDDVLSSKQDSLINNLYKILALPRYSFIHNDSQYSNRHLEIPFKHQLTPQGLKYGNRYQLNSSTIDSQFINIETPEHKLFSDFNDFKSNIRFNFQKFHKFDNIVCNKGIDAINDVIGYKKLHPSNTSMSNRQLTDLNYQFPISSGVSGGSKGFQGFFS